MKKLFLGLLFVSYSVFSQIEIVKQAQSGNSNFPIVTKENISAIYYDQNDFELVKKSANIFAEDILNVSGKKPGLVTFAKQVRDNIIIIGTVDKNQLIEELVNSKKINIDSIRNQWERFIIKTIDNPFPGTKKALVIVGSDRRGTAYGVFTISKAIGVSPWYWWADVPVVKSKELFLQPLNYISKAPTVKYRGIFLNDEDWGLKPWASKNIDVTLNDIGPRTYSKVCELLVRLKANYLWPAMHEVTGAFNKYPENRVVADSFGIIMGSSHCEPLLFNNATEWDKKTMGEWNYKINKQGILDQLDKRVKTNYQFENVYTLGLRGLHDAGMIGNLTAKEQLENLESAINDQRMILKKYIQSPIEKIPQVLIPYKEVMSIYERGLKVPDEVTLVWPDDNYGYLKRLSTPEEQKRSGRAGVYYHVSYLGEPHNYLWMSTTTPALMYEELAKAYRATADRVWVVNVGDIKGCEFSTNLFLDMAWDINSFNYQDMSKYTAEWYSKIFGQQYYNDFLEIWNKFYHLSFIRKPEFMGWGYEWNRSQQMNEKIVDTDFSFSNYNEAERRLDAFQNISNKTSSIFSGLDENQKAAFFQLVLYPVKASYHMNTKMLTAQQNRFYAQQGRSKTNALAFKSRLHFDSLQVLTDKYNSLLNNKWDGMMSLKQGWFSTVHQMPQVDSIKQSTESLLSVFGEGNEPYKKEPKPIVSIPCFSSFAPKSHFIDVVNSGAKEMDWKADVSDEWILLDHKFGKTKDEDRVNISIDWNKRPTGEFVYGEVIFKSGTQTKKVLVSTFQPKDASIEQLKGLFVEQNGYISIPAADFHRKKENERGNVITIDGIGVENKSIQFGVPMKRILDSRANLGISTEYDFYTFSSGKIKIYVYSLPVFALNPLEEAGYALMVDDGLELRHNIEAKEYSDKWKENVLRNAAITESEIFLTKPGKHTLKIMSRSQGMVIQKILIDTGGLKNSYTGPLSTKVN